MTEDTRILPNSEVVIAAEVIGPSDVEKNRS